VSRHVVVFALAGAAMLSTCVRMLGSTFLTLGGRRAPTAIPTTRSIASVSIDRGQPSVVGTTGGATTATACGLAAVAGLVLSSRNRSLISRGWRTGFVRKTSFPKPTDPTLARHIVDWQVDPKIPEPGSQIALESMIGHDVELGGGQPWDPWCLSKLYDRNFDFNRLAVWPHVQWLREAEIKHGRVCMLAFCGFVVQQWWQIPGYPQEPDWTKALDLCYQDPLAKLGVAQISIFAMLVEGRWACIDSWIGQMDREPGDLGFDPLRITRSPGFELRTKQLRELKNGRLAMIGCASFAANHAIPGSVPFLTGAF